MELFTIDDEGLHAGIEVTLGTEWLCSIGLTERLREKIYTAACARTGRTLQWRTDTRVLLASAGYIESFAGKRLDVTTPEGEERDRGQCLVLVDLHGAPKADGRDGKVAVECHDGAEPISYVRQIVRTRMVLRMKVGSRVRVTREGDTSLGGAERPLPSEFEYVMLLPTRGRADVIPQSLNPYPFGGRVRFHPTTKVALAVG